MSEVRVNHEGKPRGEMEEKPNKEVNIVNIYEKTKERGELKYVQIIPHEYCLKNFIILEIVPNSTDRNNNRTVPETTTKRKVTRNIKPKRITNNSRHCSKGETFYNKVISTLQVPQILGAKTSVLWEI